jgi:hypothetical protein
MSKERMNMKKVCASGLLLVLMLLLSIHTAYCITFSKAVLGTSSGLGHSLEIESAGSLALSYHDGGPSLSAVFATFTSGSLNVQYESGEHSSITAFTMEEDGSPLMVFSGFLNGSLFFARPVAGVWTENVLDSHYDAHLSRQSMGVDSSGRVHVVYSISEKMSFDTSATYYVRHAWFDGSSWHIETVGEGNGYPSLSIGSDDALHVAWTGSCAACSDTSLVYAYSSSPTGGIWDVDVVYEGNSEMGFVRSSSSQNAKIVLDSGDKPYICYVKENISYLYETLFLAEKDGSGWNEEVVDGDMFSVPFDVGYSFYMDIDSRDTLHVVYLVCEDYDTWNAMYATKDDGDSAWNRTFIGYADYESSISLALDGCDRPHIIYDDNDLGPVYVTDETGCGSGDTGDSIVHNVGMYDDPPNAPVAIGPDGLSVYLSYASAKYMLVGIMDTSFSAVLWLQEDCGGLDEAFAMHYTDELSCSGMSLPFRHGYVFWLVSEDSLDAIEWEDGPYELLFYGF